MKLKLHALLLLIILAVNGCAALTPPDSKNKHLPPSRPILPSLTMTDGGGICMGKQDATDLLLYIDILEIMAQ